MMPPTPPFGGFPWVSPSKKSHGMLLLISSGGEGGEWKRKRDWRGETRRMRGWR
jgi:hypothetical protein